MYSFGHCGSGPVRLGRPRRAADSDAVTRLWREAAGEPQGEFGAYLECDAAAAARSAAPQQTEAL